jgi:hypothetical protein
VETVLKIRNLLVYLLSIKLFMLVLTLLSGLSVECTFPLISCASMVFEIKGEMLMNLFLAVTSCLAGNAGVCRGCNSGEYSS